MGETYAGVKLYLDDEKSVLVSSLPIRSFSLDQRILDGFDSLQKKTYLVLPRNYLNCDFRGEIVDSEYRMDTILFRLLSLVRGLVQKGNTKIILVFDNLWVLKRFEKIVAQTELIIQEKEYTNTVPACSLINGTMLRFHRPNDKNERKTFILHGKSKHFPDNSVSINLVLSGEPLDGYNGYGAVYLKTKSQRYRSGFPRYYLPEKRLVEAIGSQKLVVLSAGTDSLPKTLVDSDYILLISEGFRIPKIKFVPKPTHALSNKMQELAASIGELLASSSEIRNPMDFFMAILISFYSKSDSPSSLQKRLILGATDNHTMRSKLEMACETARAYSIFSRLSLAIGDWHDITELAKQIEITGIEFEYYSELQNPMRGIIGRIFVDLFYAKAFEFYSSNAKDLFELSQSASKSKEEIEKFFHLDARFIQENTFSSSDEYDPEEPAGHIASDYSYKPGEKNILAHYFILKQGNKKYIFYCQIGGNAQVDLVDHKSAKKLSELRPGDVIKKDYWDYQSLKSSILTYVEEDGFEYKEILLQSVSLSDDFRTYLQRYAMDTPIRILDEEYGDMCAQPNVRGFLITWSSQTMRPIKSDMLRKVINNINVKYSKDFNFNSVDLSFGKLKEMRAKLDAEYNTNGDKLFSYYEVINGPVETNVEVEKLGKIYRIS